jgi:hypothetical protein
MNKGILTEAAEAVADRERHYGSPAQNFERVAALWTVVLGHRMKEGATISSVDVALCMMGLKIARLVNQPEHRDSQVDIAGYADCMSKVA